MSNPYDEKLTVTPAPVLDLVKVQATFDKVISAVNRAARHTECIPKIQEKVESSERKLLKLDMGVDNIVERVTKIERKVDRGHDCYQVDVIADIRNNQRETSQKIDVDVQKGIEQATRLAALAREAAATEADVEEIKKSPKKLVAGLIGAVLTVLLTIGGGVWFVAGLSKDVEHEREIRSEQYGVIKTQLEKIAQIANPQSMERAIVKLEREVKESNGHARRYDSVCSDMTAAEKRQILRLFTKRNQKIPQTCLP